MYLLDTKLAFDEALARLAGDLRAGWKTRGIPVGYRDGLIAATAKARSLVLVTHSAAEPATESSSFSSSSSISPFDYEDDDEDEKFRRSLRAISTIALQCPALRSCNRAQVGELA